MGTLALTDAQSITFTLASFFALLVVLAFLRLLLRKEPPGWTHIRVGLFVERVPGKDEESEAPTQIRPPTTYQKP